MTLDQSNIKHNGEITVESALGKEPACYVSQDEENVLQKLLDGDL